MDRALPLPLTRRMSTRQWTALDCLFAVVLLATTIASIAVGHEASGPAGTLWDVSRYSAAGVVCVSLPFRRRFPLPVLLITAAGVALLVALGVRGPAQIAVGLAIYTYAATSTRRVPLPLVASVTGVMLVAAFVPSGGPEWGMVIATPAVVLAGWLAGENTRARRVYESWIAERAIQSEREHDERIRQAATDERLRIARELHDIVAHAMSLIAVRAGAARVVLTSDPDEARNSIEIIEHTNRRALQEMRRLVGVLRQPDDPAAALEPAPGLDDLGDLIPQIDQAGVTVDFQIEGEPRSLPPGIDVSAYRIAQEALTNVVRHAGPTTAQLRVRYRQHGIEIEITDDGRTSLPTARSPRPNGSNHGLIGMRERVALYHGELIAEPTGRGFRVVARLPLDDEPR